MSGTVIRSSLFRDYGTSPTTVTDLATAITAVQTAAASATASATSAASAAATAATASAAASSASADAVTAVNTASTAAQATLAGQVTTATTSISGSTTAAATSATNAATSASTATTKATAAASSASAAATSASSASGQSAASANSATQAATSATNASSSAVNAASSATAASTSATNAAASAAAVGGKNRIINGGMLFNLRAYGSGSATAAGVYMHDRWKAGSGGCTYTFVQSGLATTVITLTAGTLVQVIEARELTIGTYTASWTGTAQARQAGSGSYSASPYTFAYLSGDVSLEFNTGTLSKVKVEAGSVATPFVAGHPQEELALCKRYYQTFTSLLVSGYGAAADVVFGDFMLPVEMRANPTVAITSSSYGNASGGAVNLALSTHVRMSLAVTASGQANGTFTITCSAEL